MENAEKFQAEKDPSVALPPKELVDMTAAELCSVLGQFIMEIRKQNGTEYPRETVYEILMAVQAKSRESQDC